MVKVAKCVTYNKVCAHNLTVLTVFVFKISLLILLIILLLFCLFLCIGLARLWVFSGLLVKIILEKLVFHRCRYGLQHLIGIMDNSYLNLFCIITSIL